MNESGNKINQSTNQITYVYLQGASFQNVPFAPIPSHWIPGAAWHRTEERNINIYIWSDIDERRSDLRHLLFARLFGWHPSICCVVKFIANSKQINLKVRFKTQIIIIRS